MPKIPKISSSLPTTEGLRKVEELTKTEGLTKAEELSTQKVSPVVLEQVEKVTERPDLGPIRIPDVDGEYRGGHSLPKEYVLGSVGDALAPDESFTPTQRLQSQDRRFRLSLAGRILLLEQVFDRVRATLWSVPLGGEPERVIMQNDGNLVVYAAGGRPLWATGTEPSPGARLLLQDDGNLVVYAADGRPLWASGTAELRLRGDRLGIGERLVAGESLGSPDGTLRLTYQSDGNLVLYAGSHALWATNTAGRTAGGLILHPDGNLVVFDAAGDPAWASGTADARASAVLQDDGNFVVYAGNGKPLWASGTRFDRVVREGDELVARGRVITGGAAALGGGWEVRLAPDGTARFSGHVHDSGADGYDFSLVVTLRARGEGGVALAFPISGSVGGTFTSGSRDFDWNEVHATPAAVLVPFEEWAFADIGSRLEYTSDIGEAFESLFEFVLSATVGAVVESVSAVIMVGTVIGALAESASFSSATRIIGGTMWLMGPENTLFALVSEAVGAVATRSQPLSRKDYDWANETVFGKSLPPRDTIVVTDAVGGSGRKFVFPSYNGDITVNLGDVGYVNPMLAVTSENDRLIDASEVREKRGSVRGEVLVHELVHVCQAAAAGNRSYVAQALASTICGAGYEYGRAEDIDYDDLGLEQQAQIVSDWYAGRPHGNAPHSNHTNTPCDPNSPYFRFIRDNLWLRRF